MSHAGHVGKFQNRLAVATHHGGVEVAEILGQEMSAAGDGEMVTVIFSSGIKGVRQSVGGERFGRFGGVMLTRLACGDRRRIV